MCTLHAIPHAGVVDTTSYVVVGAAAVLGASCRAPLTAMALMVEITRYAYTAVCKHTHVHTQEYTPKSNLVQTNTYAYAGIYACTQRCADTHTYTCTYTHTRIHICRHIHMHATVCRRTHIHIHTYTYTHTHTHMHMQAFTRERNGVQTHIHIHIHTCTHAYAYAGI